MKKVVLIFALAIAALFGGHTATAHATCTSYFAYLSNTPSVMVGYGYLNCPEHTYGSDIGAVTMAIADLTTGQWSPDKNYGYTQPVFLTGTWASNSLPLKCGHRYQAYLLWNNLTTGVPNNHSNSAVQTYLC